MRRLAIAASIATLSLLCSAGCPGKGSSEPVGPSASTPKDVVASAKAAIESWRQAYEVRSIDALASLYAHDLDLVVVNEGLIYLGWSSVESMLKDRIARVQEIHIRLKDVQAIALADDVVSAVATMTRELTEGNTAVTESGTLTIVLRRQNGAWLITSEHYSYKRS